MVWSSSALSATLLAARNANKPLLGTNIIVAPSTAKWTETGTVAATDRTLNLNPACRAYDGLGELKTKPDATSSSTWYFVLDLGSLKYLDAVALFADWTSLASTTVTLEIADNSTFSTNLTTVATLSQGLVNRSYLHFLGDGLTLYRAQYVRLKISKASPFTPQIGELLILRTRQLKTNPDEPWSPDDQDANTERATTAGGVTYITRHYNRQAVISANIVTGEYTWHSEVIAFNRECANGNGTFVWCGNPSDVSELWILMTRDDDSFRFPYSEFCRRDFVLEAHEQGPQAYFIDVEVNG